eukprot:Skav221093  [mRNA]  locus=scaffold4552:36609:37451:+ [translate_table: standard]
MHCYFSNGIANTEIILLLAAAKAHLGVTTDALQTAVQTAEWRRHAPTETRYWSKRLWTPALFGQDVYKGSADQTKAILPLFRWICASVWLAVESMRPHCECFLQLCICVDLIRWAVDPAQWRELDREQRKHQEMFAALYPDSVRPKHHHRLHLPEHYVKTGMAINCLGVESSHQDFKKLYADILQQFLRADDCTGEYSKQLLPRMLLRSLEAYSSTPFLDHGFELLNEFSAAEVAAADRLSHKSFRVSNAKAFLHYKSLPGGLHVPAWWAAKDAVITCLP